jgi:uncharacterized protein (DUF2147 family)
MFRIPNRRVAAHTALLLVLSGNVLPAWSNPSALTGTWRFADDHSLISFAACGDAICGTMVGSPTKGKDAGKKAGCGRVVVGGLQADGTEGNRFKGWTVDPDTDKRYSSTVMVDKPDALKLTVTAMGGLFSESFVLIRAGEARGNCSPAS